MHTAEYIEVDQVVSPLFVSFRLQWGIQLCTYVLYKEMLVPKGCHGSNGYLFLSRSPLLVTMRQGRFKI